MKSLALAILAAVALLLAWWFLWDERRPATPTGDPAPLAATASVPPRSAGDPRGAPAPVDPSSPRSAVDDGTHHDWIVRGRVLSAPGVPHAGARIAAQLFVGSQVEGEPLRSDELECDAQGRFAWPLPSPDRSLALRFAGAMADHGGWPETRLVAKGDPAPQDVEFYVYPLDRVVLGKVSDREGRPIAGAWLRHSRERVQCAADGSYRLRAGAAFSELRVTAGAPGHASEARTIAATAPGEHREDFALRRAFVIRGRVVDEAERPIQGATVATFFTLYDPEHSDQDGRFAISADPDRPSDTLFARLSGYVMARRTVTTADPPAEQVLVLRRGTRVMGRVIGPDGEPVASASLYLGFSPSAFDRLDAVTDDVGRFSFPAVGEGKHTLVTQRRGFAPDHRTLSIAEGVPTPEIEVRLGPAHFVAGHVVDEGGAPVAEVGVAISAAQGEAGLRRAEYLDVRGRTAADGSFRVDGLPPGEVTVELFSRTTVRKEERVQVDRDDLRLVVQRAARLAGLVLDDASGQPIPSFVVRIVRSSIGISATWVREGVRFEDPAGRWDSTGEQMAPGSAWGVEIRAPGYAPGRDLEILAALDPRPEDCVIRLRRGAAVAGVVLGADGVPLTDVTVTWLDPDQEVQRSFDEPHGLLRARTDAHGRFELNDLPPGVTQLAIESTVAPRLVDGPFTLLSGERVERLIRLAKGAVLHGILLGPDGTPGESGSLSLVAEDRSRARQDEEIGPDGRFRFATLPAAVYRLDGWLRRGTVTMPVGQSVTLGADEVREVQLRPAGRGIVRVLVPDGVVADEGTRLVLVPLSPGSGLSICSGAFFGNVAELHGVRAGTYRGHAYVGGRNGEVELTVDDAAPAEATLRFPAR